MSSQNRALIVVDVQQEYFDGPLEIQYPPRDESLAQIVRAVDAAPWAMSPWLVRSAPHLTRLPGSVRSAP